MAGSSLPDQNARASGLVADHGAGDNAAPLSVSELSAMLKRVVEDRFGFVRLRGELSGVKRAASGHFYCALKDEGAVIDGVMWRGTAQRLAFRPEDGIEVVASGKLTTYPGRSKYQIVIETMEIAGEGALLALLERTRARLAAEGLFAAERKRALPYLPRVIGVVTSPTGAVIRDILHRLADRFPSHVVVWPVLVQGEGAAAQVAAAVHGFSALPEGGDVPRPDLVIVARGGGSVEDLWAFNEEVVVRAIAGSTIPVISAVGHETDTSLADFAADERAPTPTAAAEMAVPVRADLREQLDDLAWRKRRCALRPVAMGRERLVARAERLPRADALLAPASQRLDELAERLRRALRDRTSIEREKLQAVTRHLSLPMLRSQAAHAGERLARSGFSSALVARRLARARDSFAPLERILPQLHPDKPLERGYVRVTDAEGRTLVARSDAARERALVLRFHDGDLPVTVSGGPARKARPADAPARQGDLF
jgi:exodeoxyribonuclease VII large subunit